MGLFRNGITKSLLILFFAVHYISIAFFTHAHSVDSRIVIHSHPYNPFSEKSSNHDHGDKELFHIGILSHLDVLPAYNSPGISYLFNLWDTEIQKELSIYHDLFRSYFFLLRAPPAII